MSIAVDNTNKRCRISVPSCASKEPGSAEYKAGPNRDNCSQQPTLAGASTGQTLCIRQICGQNGHTQRLRELGMYEGQTVTVLLEGNPLICQIGDGRFGICHRLARHIIVETPAATVVSKRSA